MARDFQITKVYKSEAALEDFRVFFDSLADTKTYIEYVLSQTWFKERWPEYKKVKLGDGRGRRSGVAYHDSFPNKIIHIGLPLFARRNYYVLHEIAHCLTDSDLAPHGEEFCGTYLFLIEKMLGIKAWIALTNSFDRKGVKYHLEAKK